MTVWDVVVVGGGAAGAAFAARVSEDPEQRVLLLEAGPAPRSAEEYPAELLDASALRGADPAHPDVWAYPAELLPGRDYTIVRGRILGGSTTTNGAYFVRARRADFDAWAAAGNPEWTLERSLPFLRALEHDVDYGETAVHGGRGPVFVTRPGQDHPVTRASAEAAEQLGVPRVADLNGQALGDHDPSGLPHVDDGHGPLPMDVRDGIRWNTGLAYLEPLRDRANLTVRGHSRVNRVLFEGTRAVGVELAPDAGSGTPGEVIRAREVVLSAGAIATPQLLLLSGVGPSAELERHGIPVVLDAPGVGQGLSDHPQVRLDWRMTAAAAAELPATGPAMASALHLRTSTGGVIELLPLLHPLGELLFGTNPDSPMEPGSAATVLSVLVALQTPRSRGSIALDSPDPAAPPRIRFGYLEDARDRADLRDGVRRTAELFGQPSFAWLFDGFSAGSDGLDTATLADDERLDTWIAENLGTALHTCGSARMGPAGDPGAVVDQYGHVHGLEGLRIADLSVIPVVPQRGPAVTAVLTGERMAAFLRDGH
ncbi:mycofactocin dehydrogenase MftG [Herbiconiux solani]|uniref:mycofactocin dehydrogenase MftG n=1 Tax=Herbiconiux solani TaxID=661329 RepID=UPI0008247BBF|nr:mycofactocin system GMC family oxidoreductase MftG [Herbiconiux solani]